MNKMIKLFCLMFLLTFPAMVWAQDTSVEMADGLRSNGKIYAVVAVCLTILIGLFIYLISIDRKLRNLEK